MPSERPNYTLRRFLVYVACWGGALAMYVPFSRQLQMGWDWLLIIVSIGALVGLLSGRKSLSVSGAAWGMPLSIIAAPVLGCVSSVILSQFSFNGESELRGVSYQSYQRWVDTSEFDPVGASDIYFYSRFRRDRAFSFLRMSINRAYYEQLVMSRKKSLCDDAHCFLEELDEVPKGNVLSLLDDPELLEAQPLWWKLPEETDAVTCVVVQRHEGERLTTIEALWVFDSIHEILWIVEIG